MRKIDSSHYELSTGRQFYANGGIVGMSPRNANQPDGYVPHGYDGSITTATDGDPEDTWTQAEREELTAFMIELWKEWASKAEQP